MKGLELAEKYYFDYGVPLIERQFGEYRDRMAAGLVGEGSQCYGFDDDISTDHDWGPEFCLWLNEQDYAAIGEKLSAELAALPSLPASGERKTAEWGKGRVGVFETGAFYQRFIGYNHVPAAINEWRFIPETALSTATNGKVFSDPYGAFTAFREGLLAFYPEDVRLKKIATRCTALAQLGQYNYPRCALRNEFVAAQYIEAQFAAQSISLVFLLNRRYTPFYKWMHRAVKDLPVLGETIFALLGDIAVSYGTAKKNRLIEETCSVLIEGLRSQGLTSSTSPYLIDHGPEIQNKITDIELRNIDVRME